MVIDFVHPIDEDRNQFLVIKELKKNTVDVQDAYTNNYMDTIPSLFYYNAFLMVSNGISG